MSDLRRFIPAVVPVHWAEKVQSDLERDVAQVIGNFGQGKLSGSADLHRSAS